MPYISVNGTRLYYEDSGGSGPPVVFSHGLLWSCRMYDPQVAALRERYRCIAYDHRGQGRSEVPRVPCIDMETVYEDAVALIEALGVGPCHFVGLSMGGFVGMRLAARRPELLRSLTLMETTADPEPAHHLPRYRLLTFVARWLGTSFVREPAMKIMFGRTFMSDPARQAERERWRRELSTVRRSIWRSIQGVISRAGVYEELSRISLPTLILVGEEDTATTPEEAERMHAAISSSRLIRMPRCGHTSTLENPEAVNTALLSLLDPLSLSQSA